MEMTVALQMSRLLTKIRGFYLNLHLLIFAKYLNSISWPSHFKAPTIVTTEFPQYTIRTLRFGFPDQTHSFPISMKKFRKSLRNFCRTFIIKLLFLLLFLCFSFSWCDSALGMMHYCWNYEGPSSFILIAAAAQRRVNKMISPHPYPWLSWSHLRAELHH